MMRKFLKKVFTRKRSPSPNALDVGSGSQARPPSDSKHAIVQGPSQRALGTDSPARPTLSSTPAAVPEDVAPFATGLGSSNSDDNLASDGGAPVVGNKNDLVASGDTSESSQPQACELPAPQAPALKDAIASAEAAYDGANHFGGQAAQLANDGAAAADDWLERIDSLFENISAFSDMVSVIGELHPYAKIATSLIQAGLKPILKQKARDDAMKKLIEDMSDAYDVVMSHDYRLNGVEDDKNDPRCKLLARLAQQTVECASFVREHYGTKNFYIRSVKTIPKSIVDEKIAEYSRAFVDLGQKIADRDVSYIVDLVTTVSVNESRIEETLSLQALEYAEGTGWQSHNACLPGTRTSTLDGLAHWVFDAAAPRARFLVGVAGVGKSAIAHSIASQLEAYGRLGAFFAFDRNNQRLAPWSALSTVARELADWNADFRHELSAVLHRKGRLAKSRDVIEQWQELIVGPANKVHFVGPVLIVLDGFDECTDSTAEFDGAGQEARRRRENARDLQRGRSNLLQCLTQRVEDLPDNFRVLVTSRLEEDIIAVSNSMDRAPAACSVIFSDLGDAEDEANDGINLYIRLELKELKEVLTDKQISAFVIEAGTLFEWAATACRYLLDHFSGRTVLERYNEVLHSRRLGAQSGVFQHPSDRLEDLYETILRQRFVVEEELARFRSVMAQVLYSAELLSLNSLRALRRGVDGTDDAVSHVILHLGCLLSGVGDSSALIRPLHTSFRDFLTRPGHWQVDPGDVHDVMALGALCVLNKSLRFDIWDFPSSYTWNFEIEDLDDRVRKLLAGVVYASRYWSYHLALASQSAIGLRTELRLFLMQKFIYWLEVASLLEFIEGVVPALRTTSSYFKPPCNDDISAFIDDAIQFVHNFYKPMRASVPQIYLSALTFCPTTSLVRRAFVHDDGPLPTVDGLAAAWPVELCPHHVRCFAYSPDGRHVALCDIGGNMHLVYADNMNESVRELAHAPGNVGYYVDSIVFSPNGCIIAAAATIDDDGYAILRWNAQKGEMLDISRGHTDTINSICFSPDGRYMVSASTDTTVRRWNAETGKQVDESLRWHTGSVYSAVCSLNGDIISAGDDATICIWRTGSGQQDVSPFCIPTEGPVWALSRSPKSNLIAVTINARDTFMTTLRIFDFDKRCFVGESTPTDYPGAFSWSPDGQCVACTVEGAIRLWDYSNDSSSIICLSSTGTDIQFSPDGKHIIYKAETKLNMSTLDCTLFRFSN